MTQNKNKKIVWVSRDGCMKLKKKVWANNKVVFFIFVFPDEVSCCFSSKDCVILLI